MEDLVVQVNKDGKTNDYKIEFYITTPNEQIPFENRDKEWDINIEKRALSAFYNTEIKIKKTKVS